MDPHAAVVRRRAEGLVPALAAMGQVELRDRPLDDLTADRSRFDESFPGALCLLLVGSEEERAVAAFRADDIAVGPWTLRWDSQTPVDAFTEPVVVAWPVRGEGGTALAAPIEAAAARRRAVLRRCHDCGKRFGPERRTEVNRGTTVCHGCATANHGVVF
jgi:hypothetical protein